VSCATPIGLDTLLDYWTADLIGAPADAVEEHVFGCAPCAGRLEEIEALAASIRRLTAAGRFRAAVAPSVVDLLAARGLRIRTYRARRGETIPCGAAPEDELLVGRIPVELRGVAQVDIAFCDERWSERERLVDVPIDRARSEVVVAERVDDPLVRTANVLRLRLLSVDAAGERELGTFALAHDPRGPPGTFRA
jgi:hypothetical protein